MTIVQIIDPSLFALKPTDTIEFARETLLLMQISTLPVVENHKVIGFIESSSLIANGSKTSIKSLIKIEPTWILNLQLHHHEAIRLLAAGRAQCLAAVDEMEQFKGIVSRRMLLNFINDSYTMTAEGSIIEIEMVARNYSLNELNSIIESENSKILGLTIYSLPESSKILISLKTNSIFTDRLVLSLQRFGYDVTNTFFNTHDIFDSDSRYKSFIKYLEI